MLLISGNKLASRLALAKSYRAFTNASLLSQGLSKVYQRSVVIFWRHKASRHSNPIYFYDRQF